MSVNTQRHTISLFVKTAFKYPFKTTFAIVGTITTPVLMGFGSPLIISIVLDQLQNGTISLDNSWPLIAGYAAIQFYGEVISWRLITYMVWRMETAGQRDIYHKVFDHLSSQSLLFHANRFGGALVSQTVKLSGSFERFWDNIFFQALPSIASVIAAVVIMSFIFWQYAIVLGVLSVVFIASVIIGSRFLSVRATRESKASTASNAYLADSVTNIMAIKSHGREDFELKSLNQKTKYWRDKSLHSMRGFMVVSTTYSSLMALLNISALIAAIWAVDKGFGSVAMVYLAVTYTFTVARQLWEMNGIMRNYYRIMGDAHEMTEILRQTPSIIDKSSDKLSVGLGEISINDVDFTHAENNQQLFKKLNLVIKPGQKVGLVGHSGSGKTTLTNLLLRFFDVESGSITIDGQDISQVSQKSLRRSIAYVPQEPVLFHRSLRENIAYGKPDATDEQIIEATKKANALDFIKDLPEGFDTLVGERGIKLSGGQRQRIAIARAILKDAPILILDEATSALDSESEKLIQEALGKLMQNCTSIVVAHRLSTIAKLDRIIVLDKGKVIEDGTHSELLSLNGTYARLWSHQSGGFIEE